MYRITIIKLDPTETIDEEVILEQQLKEIDLIKIIKAINNIE